jgi:type II secretory pathway component PulL
MLGGLKILVGLALMFLAAMLAGRTNAAESIRKKWRLWLSVCLILGILTVAIGSVMRTYNRTPKLDASNGPVLITP